MRIFPFTTPRLTLRPFVADDAVPATAIFGDGEVMRFSLHGPDIDPAATAARILRYAEAAARDGIGPYAAVERASATLVGFCGLIPLESGDVEIAYRFRRDRWGQGLATEAAGAMLERGFAELDVPRIVAFIEAANVASIRVVEKVGMRHLGESLYKGTIPVQLFEARNPRSV